MGPLWGPGSPNEEPHLEPPARGEWQGSARPRPGEFLRGLLKEMAGYIALLGVAVALLVVLLMQVAGWASLLDAGGLTADGMALFILPPALLGLAIGAYARGWGGFIVLLAVPVWVFAPGTLPPEYQREDAIDLVLTAIPYAIGWLLGWAIRVRRVEG
jgi:hypothetical protein